MLKKEVKIKKVEIIFSENDEGETFPHIRSMGEIFISENGKKIANIQSFRFGEKSPDEDAGDQPDVFYGDEIIKIPENEKNKLRNAQNVYVTNDMKKRYSDYKKRKEVSNPKIKKVDNDRV